MIELPTPFFFFLHPGQIQFSMDLVFSTTCPSTWWSICDLFQRKAQKQPISLPPIYMDRSKPSHNSIRQPMDQCHFYLSNINTIKWSQPPTLNFNSINGPDTVSKLEKSMTLWMGRTLVWWSMWNLRKKCGLGRLLYIMWVIISYAVQVQQPHIGPSLYINNRATLHMLQVTINTTPNHSPQMSDHQYHYSHGNVPGHTACRSL